MNCTVIHVINLFNFLSYFQGLSIVIRDPSSEVIRYFPVSNLPELPQDRFNSLFKAKEKWTLDEIAPFIRFLHDLLPFSLFQPPLPPPSQVPYPVYSSRSGHLYSNAQILLAEMFMTEI